MRDKRKTKAQLISELEALRRRVGELEQARSEDVPVIGGPDEELLQLLSIFDGMDEPVYVSDPESYEVLYANQALRTLFGDVVGRRCHDVFQGLDAPCSFCTNNRIFGEFLGDTYVWEFQNTLNRRWYRCIDRAIRWPDGRPVRYEIAIDITDRVQAEEALAEHLERLEEMVEARTRELRQAQDELVRAERLAVLGKLARGLGHELRNPLGVISNAVYFLRQTPIDSDDVTAKYLGIIASEVQKGSEIISDLLDFAEARVPDTERTSVSHLVDRLLGQQPPPSSVQVRVDMPDNLPPVWADSRQIGQVLENLVTNAYQAMPEGGNLSISAREVGDEVEVSVADTGVGISQELKRRLFEPLFTTRARGIGLGLAFSKKIVEAHGGSIRAESAEGQGATFFFTLRRADR